jgi:hypothetical protein
MSRNFSVTCIFLTNNPVYVEPLEYIMKLKSPNAKAVAVQMLTLRNKRTGEVQQFSCFRERSLSEYMDHAIVTNFDMKKLEIEYDYDTDEDQITHSKKMLLRELDQAIDFYVKEDPIKLVDNVLLPLKGRF